MHELKCYFKKINNQLASNFNHVLKKYGLTITQFDVLAFLAKSPPEQHTLTDIAAHFGVKHTSTIHVLKILEEKEFIVKSKSSDARSKTLLLTERGRQVVTVIRQKDPLVSQVLFNGLSQEDLQHLEKMLQIIYANLESDAFRNL